MVQKIVIDHFLPFFIHLYLKCIYLPWHKIPSIQNFSFVSHLNLFIISFITVALFKFSNFYSYSLSLQTFDNNCNLLYTLFRFSISYNYSIAYFLSFTSMASFNEPANKKKAADCSKRCLPSKEKAFFKAALRHLSSLKLWLKNVVIFSSCCDLGTRAQTSVVKPNFKYFVICYGTCNNGGGKKQKPSNIHLKKEH